MLEEKRALVLNYKVEIIFQVAEMNLLKSYQFWKVSLTM